MQQRIRDRTQLHHDVRDPELCDQVRSRLGAIASRVVFRTQPAGEKESEFPATQALTQPGERAQQGLEVPVVVVVADVEQAQRVLVELKLLPDVRGQGRFIPEKSLRVETVMDGHHIAASPLPQRLCEGPVGATVESAHAMERRARLPLMRVSSHNPYSPRRRTSRRKSIEV